MKIIDISVHLENSKFSDPPGLTPSLKYTDHDQTAKDVVKFFPGLKVHRSYIYEDIH